MQAKDFKVDGRGRPAFRGDRVDRLNFRVHTTVGKLLREYADLTDQPLTNVLETAVIAYYKKLGVIPRGQKFQ